MPWIRASLADVIGLDFELPIANLKAADCPSLSEKFRGAVQPNNEIIPETPAVRVFAMLWAITGMHLKPNEPNEPFGPMMTLVDGSRSAIPSDFRGSSLDVLAYMSERAANPVLRARICDTCWLLDRKRAGLGILAISSYVEIVQSVEKRALTFSHHPAQDDQEISHSSCELLRRAAQIAWSMAWEKPEGLLVRNLITDLRKRALKAGATGSALWFCELDLDFRISDPEDIAVALENLLNAAELKIEIHLKVLLWRLVARAYHVAKKQDDSDRSRNEAAECLVLEADRHAGSSMVVAHWLSAAISQLHGLPNKKKRRTELRHRLIDVQAGIPDEMSVFSHQLDLKDVVESVQTRMDKASLLDRLFAFACLTGSPSPVELRNEALKAIAEHPLQFVFGTAHLDKEGKVLHRSEGGLDSEATLEKQIAQSESVRRQVVGSAIETARNAIINHHYVSQDVLVSFLCNSPFVPNDLLLTFSQGFSRFFQGDLIGAVYILTPLLENSLRHVLKGHGHEVTKFDDVDQTQEDRTISALFEQMRSEMEDIFTKGIVADIERVFLKKPGPALRHGVAHGLLHDGSVFTADALYGCWLIFRLCCLPLLPYREEIQIIGS